MADRFPDVGSKIRAAKEQAAAKRQYRDPVAGDSLWDTIWNLDCEEFLNRVSGRPEVNGEMYTFRSTSAGKKNIYVDGKGSSCWIDQHGKIGSLSHGGPSATQWLKWFGHSYADIASIMKRLYPQLERCK